MKIAIYHDLPSGGGKRALFEMTKRLAERHQLDVYTLSTAEHGFCDLRPYCRAHTVFPFHPLPLVKRPFGRLNQGARGADLLRLDRLQRQIGEQIDARKYDLVFVHNCRFSQSPGLLKFLQTPSVYYCQEPPRVLYEPRAKRPYNQFSKAQRFGNLFDPFPHFYRNTLRRLDRNNTLAAGTVLVNSHYSQETVYRTYGIFSQVGRLGVDTNVFRQIDSRKELRVISVGALTPQKGFDMVIKSVGLIESANRPVVTVVGNAENLAERTYLQALADELCVMVDFHIGISDKELVELYNLAMLTVYLPIMEPFGFVPLESMACGTPVLGVNEAGVRETVLHDATGFLIDRNASDIGRAIIQLMEDPNRLAVMGSRGRAYVDSQWSWDRSVKAIESCLTKAT